MLVNIANIYFKDIHIYLLYKGLFLLWFLVKRFFFPLLLSNFINILSWLNSDQPFAQINSL